MKKVNKVKPKRNTNWPLEHTQGDRCQWCHSLNAPYPFLYHLFWRKCPRCETVTPTALAKPFYRSRHRTT